jgi:hypothetical protein
MQGARFRAVLAEAGHKPRYLSEGVSTGSRLLPSRLLCGRAPGAVSKKVRVAKSAETSGAIDVY